MIPFHTSAGRKTEGKIEGRNTRNKLWKKFSRLTDECYVNMIGVGEDQDIWHKTFDTLIQAIEAERSENPDFGKELFQVDEETDFEYGVEDWLMDYVDELGMRKMDGKRYEVCEKIIGTFAWKEQFAGEYRFEMASALKAQGKIKEAVSFCEKWYEEEPEDPLSAVALIYARITAEDYEGAGQLVEKYIQADEECTEDNELVYRAAVHLYEEKGDAKTAKRMKKSLEKYEKEAEKELLEEFEELPFGDEFDDWEYDDEFDDMEDWDEFDESEDEDDEKMGVILPFK